jgi:ATP-dependent DNA helicase RecQ
MHAVLQQLHGYSTFRPGQHEALERILREQSTLCILPTATGKSLVYFLAARAFRARYPTKFVCVISPLIALMRDQVQQAPSYIRATFLGTGQTDPQVEEDIWCGAYDVVYISPEKFRHLAGPTLPTHVSLVVVDEAHCLTEDGNTYRPAYLDVGPILRHKLPAVPVLALTATATPAMQKEIIAQLQMSHPCVIQTNMNRPNLRYSVWERAPEYVRDQILPTLQNQSTGRTIIYGFTRALCETVHTELTNLGFQGSVVYHAGLPPDQRSHVLATQPRCIVATVAFGLGINIPDVRTVIHVGIPGSLCAYVQETGRAGRDGGPSQCILLHAGTDVTKRVHIVRTAAERQKLQLMETWAHSAQCRRVTMLQHFGQALTEVCSGCDRCSPTSLDQRWMYAPATATVVPLHHFHLLRQAIRQTGSQHGRRCPIDYLRGSQRKAIRRFLVQQHKARCVHGRGKEYPVSYWMQVHREMERTNQIVATSTRRGFTVFTVPELNVMSA